MSPEIYKKVISPVLDRLDSETWHDRAREALHLAEMSPLTLKILEQFAYKHERFSDPRLRVSLAGREFENPLMVGAGWDKAGRAVLALSVLGFAGVEVGSVTAFAQPGNPKRPKPRQFMIGPGVALNWLGFNSPGMEKVAQNLRPYKGTGIPIGISLGKNKDVPNSDAPCAHAQVAQRLQEFATYFALNPSSPNTTDLRELQEKALLIDNAQAVQDVAGDIPLFVKIAPDLSDRQVDDIIQVILDHRLAGIIATNTTTRSDLKAKYGEQWRNQDGGLSGDDSEFRDMSTQKIAHIFQETNGKVAIIGSGGVNSAQTALDKIQAGATIVQIVTGLRSEGPALPGKINRELVAFMERAGIRSLDEIRGSALR